jgi:hypothetical protein
MWRASIAHSVPLRRIEMKLRSCRELHTLEFVFAALTCGCVSTSIAGPIPNDALMVTAAMDTGDALGGANSNYNPRNFAGSNFVLQINNNGLVRYDVGAEVAAAAISLEGGLGGQARMWSPMDAGTSSDWVLLAGGADEGQFSRLPYSAENTADRVFAGPANHEPNSFDWVDNDTIVYSSYEFRNTIYLADVTADPFMVTTNTTWNTEGAVSTAAERIRNVRVGDVYDTHAYYAEAAVDTNATVWALDLATGTSTEVAKIEHVSGDGSWGLWTIKEVDGYLYVQTSHDGVYVYEMEDATTLGPLFTHYTKETLDGLMSDAGGTVSPNWGFDVANKGSLMLLGGTGMVIEIGMAAGLGDVNLDGVVNGLDVDPFVDVLLNGPYQLEADMNGDGDVNGLDVDPFVAAVVGGGLTAVPEPATLVLLAMAGLLALLPQGRCLT